MTDKHWWRPKPSTSLTSGTALVVVAIALITLSRSFDGFRQGLLAGAGVALVLIGVAALSPLLRQSAGRTSGTDRSSAATEQRPGASGASDASDESESSERTGGDAVSDRDDPDQGWLPSRDSHA